MLLVPRAGLRDLSSWISLPLAALDLFRRL
jgi:hypothetical protein